MAESRIEHQHQLAPGVVFGVETVTLPQRMGGLPQQVERLSFAYLFSGALDRDKGDMLVDPSHIEITSGQAKFTSELPSLEFPPAGEGEMVNDHHVFIGFGPGALEEALSWVFSKIPAGSVGPRAEVTRLVARKFGLTILAQIPVLEIERGRLVDAVEEKLATMLADVGRLKEAIRDTEKEMRRLRTELTILCP